MSEICNRLNRVNDRIRLTAQNAKRAPEHVRLLAVSKTFPADAIRAAWDCGQRCFGENYAGELARKATELADLDIEWHFIGHLQSNKTRLIATFAHWVHSIDRLSVAERLSHQRSPDMPPLQVCLQVNISGETRKSGVSPENISELAHAVATLPHLHLRGLMALPAISEDPTTQRATFALVRSIRDRLIEEGLTLDTLSMGMSGDLEAAVSEGATLVRVGSAIFGSRL